MDLAKIPDVSCNLQNPPGRKFRVRKRGHVRENTTYGSPTLLLPTTHLCNFLLHFLPISSLCFSQSTPQSFPYPYKSSLHFSRSEVYKFCLHSPNFTSFFFASPFSPFCLLVNTFLHLSLFNPPSPQFASPFHSISTPSLLSFHSVSSFCFVCSLNFFISLQLAFS